MGQPFRRQEEHWSALRRKPGRGRDPQQAPRQHLQEGVSRSLPRERPTAPEEARARRHVAVHRAAQDGPSRRAEGRATEAAQPLSTACPQSRLPAPARGQPRAKGACPPRYWYRRPRGSGRRPPKGSHVGGQPRSFPLWDNCRRERRRSAQAQKAETRAGEAVKGPKGGTAP